MKKGMILTILLSVIVVFTGCTPEEEEVVLSPQEEYLSHELWDDTEAFFLSMGEIPFTGDIAKLRDFFKDYSPRFTAFREQLGAIEFENQELLPLNNRLIAVVERYQKVIDSFIFTLQLDDFQGLEEADKEFDAFFADLKKGAKNTARENLVTAPGYSTLVRLRVAYILDRPGVSNESDEFLDGIHYDMIVPQVEQLISIIESSGDSEKPVGKYVLSHLYEKKGYISYSWNMLLDILKSDDESKRLYMDNIKKRVDNLRKRYNLHEFNVDPLDFEISAGILSREKVYSLSSDETLFEGQCGLNVSPRGIESFVGITNKIMGHFLITPNGKKSDFFVDMEIIQGDVTSSWIGYNGNREEIYSAMASHEISGPFDRSRISSNSDGSRWVYKNNHLGNDILLFNDGTTYEPNYYYDSIEFLEFSLDNYNWAARVRSDDEGDFISTADGLKLGPFDEIVSFTFYPDSINYGFIEKKAAGYYLHFSTDQGNPLGPFDEIQSFQFAPYPYIYKWAGVIKRSGSWYVLLDTGDEFGPYVRVDNMSFSADALVLGFSMRNVQGEYLVLTSGVESGPYEGITDFAFSADSTGWHIKHEDSKGTYITLDDRTKYGPWEDSGFVFSKDGKEWGRIYENNNGRYIEFQDGSTYGPGVLKAVYSEQPGFEGFHWLSFEDMSVVRYSRPHETQ